MSKKISNVALLTFEGVAFNVTFLALLLILENPFTCLRYIKYLAEAFDSCQECN
jgi:hypothetical protein